MQEIEDVWSPDPEDEHFMMCTRVEYYDGDIMPGSVQQKCHDCDAMVWCAPVPTAMPTVGGPGGAGQIIDMTRLNLLKVCGPCAVKRAEDDDDPESAIRMRVMILMVEGQVAP